MPKTTQTLLVIPDISGFSSFVNEVALSHSEHIISELLELILNTNDLGLKVSEIEGDAVLFYKTDRFPEPDQLLKTIERMFIRFHEHLLLYKHNSICQCGACQTAHELSLKVVIDLGFTSEIKIKKHHKLIGPSLISAHRLLKNKVPSTEYLLLSENYHAFLARHLPQTSWAQWQELREQFQGIGAICYHYTLLTPLKEKLRWPEERKIDFSVKYPLILRQKIKAPYQEVFRVISNSKEKENWVKGIDKVIRQTSEEIERIGSKHLCVVRGRPMEFEAVQHQSGPGVLEFVEVLRQLGPLKDVAMVYRCSELAENRTSLTLEVHFSVNPWLRPFFYLLLLWTKKDLRHSLINLKTYLEGLYPQSPGRERLRQIK